MSFAHRAFVASIAIAPLTVPSFAITNSGDTGGPVFLGDFRSNQIVGVTSFGLNALYRGADFAYRTDRTAVHDWIASPQ